MVTINLLSWRARKRAYEIRATKIILYTSIIMGAFSVVIAQTIVWKREQDLQKHVAQLKEEVRQRVAEPEFIATPKPHAVTVAQLKRMYSARAATEKMLSEMALENGKSSVCFTELTRVNGVINFSGNVRSGAELTEFLKYWRAGALFPEIKIIEMRQTENQIMHYRFQTADGQYKHD